MRALLVLGALTAFSGCWTEPSWRKVGAGHEDWDMPGREYAHVVSAPLTYEELPDYVERMSAQGWDFWKSEPAGPELPARYLVICRRVGY